MALSGGADSSALLKVIVALAGGSRHLPIRAVHIDHGLQAASAQFGESCRNLCEHLQVPLTVLNVKVHAGGGHSLEAAARAARYSALAEQLRPGECLVTAHHRRDQAETLLLQAFRGSGVRGMSAMPVCRPFGAGYHLRPALDLAQTDLLAPQTHAVAVPGAPVQDPMNEDMRFDRNYLRRKVWPVLEERWPGATTALSRAARHLNDAQTVLDRLAGTDVSRLRDGEALSITGLRSLSGARRNNAVRLWLHEAGIDPPSTARLQESLRQLFDAAPDNMPAIEWGSHAMRRYRHRLFVTPANPPQLEGARRWYLRPDARVDLGPGLGRLLWTKQRGGLDASRMPETVLVRKRQGGETLKPARRARTQSIQHLCQAQGVLPWMRDALPLLVVDDAVIAVADLWLDARWCAAANAPGFIPVWENAPIIV